MNKNGPIIVVDDDADDRHLFLEAFGELNYPNRIITFDNGEAAYNYLVQADVHPFFVLSDINMPRVDGFELRRLVTGNEVFKNKCVPFLLITTSTSKSPEDAAYELSVTGYFVKPQSYAGLKATIKTIVDYWKVCYSPNDPEPARVDYMRAGAGA